MGVNRYPILVRTTAPVGGVQYDRLWSVAHTNAAPAYGHILLASSNIMKVKMVGAQDYAMFVIRFGDPYRENFSDPNKGDANTLKPS